MKSTSDTYPRYRPPIPNRDGDPCLGFASKPGRYAGIAHDPRRLSASRVLPVSILIFDLDGTISDPSVGIGRSFNYALEAAAYPPLAKEQVESAIGPPLDVSFRRFCPEADEATIVSLVATYRERYGRVGYAESALYPGVEAALQALSAEESGGTAARSTRGDRDASYARGIGLARS